MPRRRPSLNAPAGLTRGSVWDVELPGIGRHPVVVVTRPTAIPVLTSIVCVLVTSTIRLHAAEVEVGEAEGLTHASAINCDNVFTLPKATLTRRRGALGPAKLADLDRALGVALGLR